MAWNRGLRYCEELRWEVTRFLAGEWGVGWMYAL